MCKSLKPKGPAVQAFASDRFSRGSKGHKACVSGGSWILKKLRRPGPRGFSNRRKVPIALCRGREFESRRLHLLMGGVLRRQGAASRSNYYEFRTGSVTSGVGVSRSGGHGLGSCIADHLANVVGVVLGVVGGVLVVGFAALFLTLLAEFLLWAALALWAWLTLALLSLLVLASNDLSSVTMGPCG